METFAAFVKSHPALLQPAFSMQQTLRERILGGAWWDRRSHERVKVNGMNLRIHDLMKAHLHEGAFHAFMKAVEKSDAKEYKKDADMHRDFSVNWKATVEVTGMVAQRRARQGIYETQSAEILDKYSSGKARERRGSQDDLRKVRPCVEIKLQPHAIDAITNSLVDFHTGETRSERPGRAPGAADDGRGARGPAVLAAHKGRPGPRREAAEPQQPGGPEHAPRLLRAPRLARAPRRTHAAKQGKR